MKNIWERVKNEISKKDSRIRSELQEIDGQKLDVWKWIKSTVSPKKTRSVEEICSFKFRIDHFLSL